MADYCEVNGRALKDRLGLDVTLRIENIDVPLHEPYPVDALLPGHIICEAQLREQRDDGTWVTTDRHIRRGSHIRVRIGDKEYAGVITDDRLR